MGSNPVQAWIFFRPSFHYYLSSVHYSEDHFHIHVFSRSWNIWLPYIHNRLFVCLSVNRSIYPSVYLSMCLSIVLSICLSIYLSICRSFYIYIYLSIYLSIDLSVCLYIYLSVCLSVHLSIYLSIYHLSVYRPIHLSVRMYIYISIYLPIYLNICLSIFLSIYVAIYFISVAMITLHVNTLGYGNFSTRLYHLYQELSRCWRHDDKLDKLETTPLRFVVPYAYLVFSQHPKCLHQAM